MPRRGRRTTSTAARRRLPGGPSTRPGGVPLKEQHVGRAHRDIESGRKDTEGRGIPSNVPKKR